MARILGKLSAVAVKNQSRPGYYGDGGGLWLQVARTADPKIFSKSWIFRFTLAGRSQEMGLGSIHTIGLAAARLAAAECRTLLQGKINPIDHRNQARADSAVAAAQRKTFAWCAEEYHKLHESTWKNKKHADQWLSTLTTYAFPKFGDKLVSSITSEDIVGALEPIWLEKPETASRVRQRLRSVMTWAAARGFRKETDPRMWEAISESLPKTKDIKKPVHFAACPYAEVASAITTIQKSTGAPSIKAALEFAVLTAARSGEVRKATWSEIDLKAKRWTIPAEKMKAGVEHRVPLSDRAIAILEAQKDMHKELVFPSPRGKVLSDMSFTMLLRRLEMGFTAHGFRSSFRDWSAEQTNFPREVCEAALAHVSAKGSVEAAYFRSDLFEKRREMMEQWAGYLENPEPNADDHPSEKSVP